MFRFILSILLFASVVNAQPSQVFDDLRTQFFSLRNTDANVDRAESWINLAEDLNTYARAHNEQQNSAQAFYYSALAASQLYQKFDDRQYLTKSIEALSQIVKLYPTNSLADDALLRQAVLHAKYLDDLQTAQELLSRIIDGYRNSDSVPLALVYQHKILTKQPLEDSLEIAQAPGEPQPEQLKQGRKLVVIDPGHGGEDFGGSGVLGLVEKDVTLDVAFRLKKLLEKELGLNVRLTRQKDEFVPLVERTNFANDFEADLFISLHANASPKSDVSGVEVFYLDTKGDASARKLAERENKSVEFEGAQGDLQYILSDLIQTAKLEDSIALANVIQKNLVNTLKLHNIPTKNLGVKKAMFYVLVGAHMPCVLVEMSFIDHPLEGPRLASAEYRQTLAKGILGGVKEFFERSS